MEESLKEHLYIVVLCGGSGKRLWPKSTAKSPKQFIKLFGEKTLFQETIDRCKALLPINHLYLITNIDYVDDIKKQDPQLPLENIIAEPLGRNTAMAMGVASAYLHHKDPESVIVFFPSDHYINDSEKFNQAIQQAFKAAAKDEKIVTVGLKPTFPHTGLGYIKTGNKLSEFDNSVYQVTQFVEKPDENNAKSFVESGEYYWNLNYYVWKSQTIFKAFEKYLPEMAKDLELLEKMIGTSEEVKTLEQIYDRAQEISIDKGISEKADNLILVPAEFGWSDVGDWKVVYDVSSKDKNNNVVIQEKGDGEYLAIDSRNCLIHFSDQLVATIGVKDLIIIDTKEALLIAQKDCSQEVKDLVNLLKEKGKTRYL